MKNKFWRLCFNLRGVPAGSMLVVAETCEMAISRGCAHLQKAEKVSPVVISCSALFWSDEEARDFFHAVEIMQKGDAN